jgi:putative chitinase
MTVIGVAGIVKPKPATNGIKAGISKEKLLTILPAAKNCKDLDAVIENLNMTLSSLIDETNFANIKRQAAFIAQCAHESGSFTTFIENLNYSAEGLHNTFPKYFASVQAAKPFERQPEKIANKVYGGRMGNNTTGEGWKFRGRGLIQLTGKENYTKCGKTIGVDLLTNPDYASTIEGAFKTALWFWNSNGLNAFADKEDLVGMTKKINGGTKGLEERKEFYHRAVKVLSEGK